jgi:hypothetical protein
MKIKNSILIVVLLIIFLLSLHFSGLFSILTDDKDFTCDIIKDNCTGYTNCELKIYKMKTIGCINIAEVIIVEPVGKITQPTKGNIMSGENE